ncbi:MBL fold metallo-hydrolase [Butyrivibrio proteoclasticus]|uniref:MBL fold metallo-hydrolase n=1 Tax=Butyrivibrio proteoclasticus TaxID=43305 RepID=UPI000479534A|nr:MBL fold metallo-hydrolase [Butyrivibrio proteoclasticus]
MNKYLEEIQNTTTPQGTAALWWLGQMGFIIKMGQTVIAVDYFASDDIERLARAPIPAKEMEGIDAYLGTHNHLDHIDHDAWKIWAGDQKPKFIFPRAHMESVLADGVKRENAVGLNDGESVTIGDITITAVAASHEFLDQDPETGLFPYLQYIIEGNGVRIHHAGDSVRYEGMLPKIKSYGQIDAEILPINGRDAVRYRDNCIGNMTYQEAADFAAEVGTRLVIPGHFDMFAHNGEDPKRFADFIDAKYSGRLTCHIPDYMDKIIVKA